MNKKYYIAFGLMGFFALAMVSALVVDYLSNKAEVTVTVESPFSFEVSADGTNWIEGDPATLPLENIYAGESIHFFARDTNLANVPTIGDSSKIITCDTGLNCSDFSSVEAQTIARVNGTIKTTSQVWEIISLCKIVDANTVEFAYGTVGNPLVVGQADTTEITVTFQPNALGDYIFTLQKMD